MIEMDLDHFEIASKSLSGKRVVDDKTSASLAILSERLERVNKLGGIFENVAFSPAVKELKSRLDLEAAARPAAPHAVLH